MPRRLIAAALSVAALTACATLTACAQRSGEPLPPPIAAPPTGELVVFAASSLTGALDALKAAYTTAHPGTTLTINYGASSTLAAQITQGAPADVFAAASPETMQTVAAAGRADTPVTIAKNTLTIAVPARNRAAIKTPADLTKPGVKVAVCQKAAPCGGLAAAMLKKANLAVTPVTEEADVKAVLAKVKLGEVDAGLVYTTDVKAAGNTVTSVPFPAAQALYTQYPLAALTSAKNPSLALSFVQFVASAQGRKVLAEHGFAAP